VLALKFDPFITGKGQFYAVIGTALGEQGLWAEQGIQAEFCPSFVACQVLFQQRVVGVVAGVAFVATQIYGRVNVAG